MNENKPFTWKSTEVQTPNSPYQDSITVQLVESRDGDEYAVRVKQGDGTYKTESVHDSIDAASDRFDEAVPEVGA